MQFSRFNKVGAGILLVFLLGTMAWSASAQDLRRYTLSIDLPKGGHVSGICLIRMEGGQ